MGTLRAKSKTFEPRELPPAGRYKALVIGVYDIGIQTFPKESTHQIVVEWELHKRKKGGAIAPVLNRKGHIHKISEFYSFKFGVGKEGNKAKLRTAVESMLGRIFTDAEAVEGYDVEELVGMACEIQIQHEPDKKNKEVLRAKISSLLAYEEDDDKPEPVSDSFYYEVDTGKPIPEAVPKWLHAFIERSENWIKANGQSQGDRSKQKTATGNGANPLTGSQSGQFDETDEDEDEDDDSPNKPPF